MKADSPRTFFRQSGWMVLATGIGGAFMFAVHPITARIEEYTIFAVLLRALIPLGIPTAGLQIVFAQQTAAGVTELHFQQLRRAARSVMGVLFVGWLAFALLLFLRQQWILDFLRMKKIEPIWMTMFVLLVSLWLPVLRGILQGQQNFMGLGWAAILDGAGRLVSVAIVIGLMQGQATGAMGCVVLGQLAVLIACLWWTRDIFKGASAPFVWKTWFKKLVPLTLGPGALLFVQSADPVYVKSAFPPEFVKYYVAVNVVGFAVVQFTGPLVFVMYPKIVRSVARTEKTDALKLTFLTTAAVGGAAALLFSIFPQLPLRLVYFSRPDLWEAAPLVPWFFWCVVATTLANVLIGNLLARERFVVVPWLVAIAVGYGLSLYFFRDYFASLAYLAAFKRIILLFGSANLALLAVAAFYTWRRVEISPSPESSAAGAR